MERGFVICPVLEEGLPIGMDLVKQPVIFLLLKIFNGEMTRDFVVFLVERHNIFIGTVLVEVTATLHMFKAQ